jgi:two-component system phosphate regulon response regulator PhoB
MKRVKQTIFIVEDDPDIVRLTEHSLQSAGYDTRAYPNTQKVVADAERRAPSLFLLDIMLPGSSGLELCTWIRKSQKLVKIPIIFLTAKSSELDRVTGLELGADDYVTKPFSPRELVLRVKAVLRRFEKPLGNGVLEIGDLNIDAGAMILKVRGEVVPTTATEFRLLEYLARNAGTVFSRDDLLDAVWRDTAFVTPRSVDVYVRRLREKIERDPENPAYLRTVRGAGYRFERSQ